MRKKTIFTINGKVIIEQSNDLYVDEIDAWKRVISEECACKVDDIDVEIKIGGQQLSDMDVNDHGLYDWTTYDKYFKGLSMDFEIGSDEYLDAISNGTLLDKIKFI